MDRSGDTGDRKSGTIVHDRYRLVERIGGGGMGHVFRAEDLTTGRVVALKLLHRDLCSSPDVAARLFQEAKLVWKIHHPNIVDVLEAGNSDAGPFIAMELLVGASAGALLSALGRFDEAAAIAVAIPVLEALGAAHREGVVHRDLKPENVFVGREAGPDGEVVDVHLLDFGVAKLEAPASDGPRTRTGVVFGTPDYLSPEQASGEGTLDGRSDLFSLGVVLFELLTGRRPFSAGTPVATAFRIVHAAPPSFESVGVTVSPPLRALIHQLLAKAPDNRPATAAHVAAALRALAPDEAARTRRLARLLEEAASRPRRSSRPPAPATLSRAPAGLEVGSSPSATPRAFAAVRQGPQRTARGPVLASLDGGIEARFGELGRERVVALMPDMHADELRRGRPSALDAHDVDAVRLYAELASRVLSIDLAGFRRLGREAVHTGLTGFVTLLLRPDDLVTVVSRGAAIWSRFFGFGAWSLPVLEPDRVRIRVTDFGPASPPLRAWLVGVIEEVATVATGRPTRITELLEPDAPPEVMDLEVTPDEVAA